MIPLINISLRSHEINKYRYINMSDQSNMLEMLDALRRHIKEDNEHIQKQSEDNITQKLSKKIDERFDKIEANISMIQATQEEHERRLDHFDKILRQRNLIIFGIAEEERGYKELAEIIVQIINLNLDIDFEQRDIEFVGRIGKKNTKPRPIRLTLTTFGKKVEILKMRPKDNQVQWYIKEDYPPKILQKRKELQVEVNELREQGIKAVIKYDKIVKLNKNGSPSQKASTSANQGNKRQLSKTPEDFNKNKKKEGNLEQKTKKIRSQGMTSFFNTARTQQTKAINIHSPGTSKPNDNTTKN